MNLLKEEVKNKVLQSMMDILDGKRKEIIEENKKDLEAFDKDDCAMYDRLVVDNAKVDSMIQSVREVMEQDDPVGKTISTNNLENGLKVINKTDPFGKIMIIYESRPDVTIEAAVLAFKANNKILLKGGKEAINSNKILVDCWHKALEENGLDSDWVQLLVLNRQQTRDFMVNSSEDLDLIVPRGGERLIQFVKENAKCAVLISGRGNNFIYVAKDADWEKSLDVILNAKTHKISACNALDKILIDERLPKYEDRLKELQSVLKENNVEIMVDEKVKKTLKEEQVIADDDVWYEEFLALKACIGSVGSEKEAIEKINKYSGGHSNSIMTESEEAAKKFMEIVDAAAVYHNASTRFTDGGQMGVGAELAISTDKLHHRGPLGLKQLVTNKYYVYGDGQVRK